MLGILSAIMVIVGVCLLGVAGWIFAAFGTNGVASSSLGKIASASASRAIIIDIDSTRVSIPVLPVHGTTTLHLDSVDQGTLIAGSSDKESVDAYVGSRDIDVAYRSEGSWNLTNIPGSSVDQPWGTTPSWITSGTSVDVDLTDGSTVLIANADGASGVDVEASLRFVAAGAPRASLALGISGAVLTLAGLALAFGVIWLMRRRRDELTS